MLPTRSRRRAIHWLALTCLAIAAWLAPGLAQVALAQTTTVCHAATAKGTDGPIDYGAYCWIDFAPLSLSQAKSGSGQSFRVNLRGGAYLTFMLRITPGNAAGNNMYAVAVPSWTGAAFGNSAFNNIPGRPILYQDQANQNGPQDTVTLSSLVLHANGSTELPFVFVAADGESSNANETLSFSTTGQPWALVSAPGESNPARNMPLLNPPTSVGNNTGSQTVTITGTDGGTAGEGSYVFTTNNSPGTVTATMKGNGLQGVLFGLKYHTIGLSLEKSHVGEFKAGGTGTYTIDVANTVIYPTINPPTEPQPVRVVDTLPSGLTFASASGPGWSCTNAGQVVTCNTTTLQDLTTSRTFPPITIGVNVASNAPSTVINQAEVSDPTTSTLVFNVCETADNGVCPNSATSSTGDPTGILHSNLSTSTKTVQDRNGGNPEPGDVLEYTITLNESAGLVASNVSVADDMPPNVGNLTVVGKPAGSTDTSTTSGGANGTGRVAIGGITVPANGSATIVYRVTIPGGTPNGTSIDNDAQVTNPDPNGTGATPAAPTITVIDPAPASQGNKRLYLSQDGFNPVLTRNRPTAPATVTLNSAVGDIYFALPPLAAQLKISNPVTVTLRGRRVGNSGNRRMRVQLYRNGTGAGNAITGVSGSMDFNVAGYTNRSENLTSSVTTFQPGDQIILRLESRDNRDVELIQADGANYSFVQLNASTVIHVNSVGFHAVPYTDPNPNQPKANWEPGETVFIRAEVSDPIAGFDVSAVNSKLTLLDADGGPPVLNGATMVARTSPLEGDGNPLRILEYAYVIPANASTGTWTATVTASEGAENTVTHVRSKSFSVVPPALTIAKSHAGDFVAAADNSYTLLVSNAGSPIASGTTTVVKDTLAAGLSFVSGTGTGWTCAAAAQVVTCTSTAGIPAGADMAPITLTVAVAGSMGTTVSNQASVGNSSVAGGAQKPGNIDTATILHSDLSQSSKDVQDPNGGDVAPGDTLRYTIVLTESAGAAASNVSVMDTLPANTTGLAVVSLPAGSVDVSDASKLAVTGITVPANGSVAIVFDVTVGNVSAGTTIDNIAAITNPGGPGANPMAETKVVLESQVIAPKSGTKVLYLYDNGTMSRVQTSAPNTAGVNIARNGAAQWTLAPALAKDLVVARPGTINVSLPTSAACSLGFWCFLVPNPEATLTVELLQGGASIGTSAPQNITGTAVATRGFTIALTGSTPLTIPANAPLVLRVSSESDTSDVRIYQYNGGQGTVSFFTTTVINVDSVGIYAGAYGATSTKAQYAQGDTMHVRALVSDPFGAGDITRAELTLTDAAGNELVAAQPMDQVLAAGTADGTKTFEMAYQVPANPRTGTWVAKVTAVEGTELKNDGSGEPEITHTGMAHVPVHGFLTLGKTWSAAASGDAVDLTIAGGSSTAPGTSAAPSTTSVATGTAGPGATITLAESFTSGSAGNYTPSLTCTKATDGTAIAVSGTGLSRTIVMPDDSAVACVWSNTWTVPLTVVKLSTVVWDPISGSSNPKAIPGAIVEYQIIVTNPAPNPIDADTVFLVDPLPEHTVLRVADFPGGGAGPVSFDQDDSGLTYDFESLTSTTDDIAFSSDGGLNWTYAPSGAVEFDPAVDAIRVNPKGPFNAGNAKFTVKFRVRIE